MDNNSSGRTKKALYRCPECGFEYEEKEWAEKCEVWCRENKSCNLEITKRAVKMLYTCPMHTKVRQENPGMCPECGMVLVPASDTQKSVAQQAEDKGLGVLTWRNYIPLVVIILMLIGVAAVVSSRSRFSIPDFVLAFMTGFFLVFAGFKLMDLHGFAKGYSVYDLLAQKWFGYGYLYPFIELTFGFLMLAGYHADWLLWTEFGVMAFSGLGVAAKLAKREPFMCACLGTFLKVPLTYVTLVEDFGMAALALLVIFLI